MSLLEYKMSFSGYLLTVITVFFLSLPTSILAKGYLTRNDTGTVHQDLAEFVATKHIRKYYGELTLVDNHTYFDADGNPNVYAIIYARKNVNRYDLSSLKVDAASATEEITNLNNLLFSSDDEVEKNQIREKLYEANNLLTGHNEFVTVIVDATKSKKPVIHSYHGLPIPVWKSPTVARQLEVLGLSDSYTPVEVVFESKLDYYVVFETPGKGVTAFNIAKKEMVSEQTLKNRFNQSKIAGVNSQRALDEWQALELEYLGDGMD